jgi:hypothetical protein
MDATAEQLQRDRALVAIARRSHPSPHKEMGAQNVDRRYTENMCLPKSSLAVSNYSRSLLVENLQPDWETIIVWLILAFGRVCFCSDIVSGRSCFVLGEKTAAVVFIVIAYMEPASSRCEADAASGNCIARSRTILEDILFLDDRFQVRDEGTHERMGFMNGLAQKSHRPPHLLSFERSKVNRVRKSNRFPNGYLARSDRKECPCPDCSSFRTLKFQFIIVRLMLANTRLRSLPW